MKFLLWHIFIVLSEFGFILGVSSEKVFLDKNPFAIYKWSSKIEYDFKQIIIKNFEKTQISTVHIDLFEDSKGIEVF